MRLYDVGIKNIGLIGDVFISCRRVTQILAPNGTGKTTILRCVQMALFGHCYKHNGKEITLAEMAGTDTTQPGTISLVIEGPDKKLFTVTWTLKDGKASLLVVNDVGDILGTSQKESRDLLWACLDVDPARAEAGAFCFDALENMSDYFRGRIDEAQVYNAAAHYETRLRDYVALCGLNAKSVDNLDAIGKIAYKERTEVNRRIKDVEAQCKNTPTYPIVNGKVLKDAAAVKIALDKLKTALEELSRRIGSEQGGTRTPDEIAADILAVRTKIEKAKQVKEPKIETSSVCPTCGQNIVDPEARDLYCRWQILQQEIARDEAHLERLLQEKPKQDVASLENEARALRSRIQAGQEALYTLERINALEAKHEALRADIEHKNFLDWVCDNLRGKLQAELTLPQQEAFLKECNRGLSEININLVLGDDANQTLYIERPGKTRTPYTLLSTGERCFVAGVAAGTLVGNGLVIVDNFDAMDSKRQQQFMATINPDCAYLIAGAVAKPEENLYTQDKCTVSL